MFLRLYTGVAAWWNDLRTRAFEELGEVHRMIHGLPGLEGLRQSAEKLLDDQS